MTHSVEIATAILFAVFGLSYLLQPRAWVEFFVALRDQGEVGVFIYALTILPIGIAVVVFHDVWSGIPLALTLVGWGLLFKSTLYLCIPKIGLWRLARVSLERVSEVRVVGAGLIGFACVIAYGAYRA